MIAVVAVLPARIRKRWDAIAFAQLCEAAARLADENEDLQRRLYHAEDTAEFWGQQATEMHLQLCEQSGGAPGITQSGALVVVPADSPPKEVPNNQN